MAHTDVCVVMSCHLMLSAQERGRMRSRAALALATRMSIAGEGYVTVSPAHNWVTARARGIREAGIWCGGSAHYGNKPHRKASVATYLEQFRTHAMPPHRWARCSQGTDQLGMPDLLHGYMHELWPPMLERASVAMTRAVPPNVSGRDAVPASHRTGQGQGKPEGRAHADRALDPNPPAVG